MSRRGPSIISFQSTWHLDTKGLNQNLGWWTGCKRQFSGYDRDRVHFQKGCKMLAKQDLFCTRPLEPNCQVGAKEPTRQGSLTPHLHRSFTTDLQTSCLHTTKKVQFHPDSLRFFFICNTSGVSFASHILDFAQVSICKKHVAQATQGAGEGGNTRGRARITTNLWDADGGIGMTQRPIQWDGRLGSSMLCMQKICGHTTFKL